MNHHPMQIAAGGCGVLLLVLLVVLRISQSADEQAAPDHYLLRASFNNVGQLEPGSAVRVAGMRLGQVVGVQLNYETLKVETTLAIRNGITIPIDSVARILPYGLNGSMVVGFSIGGEDRYFQPGQQIRYTQEAINLIDRIGRVLSSPPDASPDSGS